MLLQIPDTDTVSDCSEKSVVSSERGITDDGPSHTAAQSVCTESESTDRPFITYPAPLPKFSQSLEDVLRSGIKSRVMLVYGEIVKEASTFYSSIVPTETARAKVSMAHIGRTMTKQYPALAVADRSNPWTHFNEKLSSYLRNGRNRIKKKLGCSDSEQKQKSMSLAKVAAVAVVPKHISTEEYLKYISDIKTETAKRTQDMNHLKQLLFLTYMNRRAWIDETPSSQLRLSTVLETFPCFRYQELLVEELAVFKGRDTVDGFPGEMYIMLCVIIYFDLI
jgi:hypothetical protein